MPEPFGLAAKCYCFDRHLLGTEPKGLGWVKSGLFSKIIIASLQCISHCKTLRIVAGSA